MDGSVWQHLTDATVWAAVLVGSRSPLHLHECRGRGALLLLYFTVVIGPTLYVNLPSSKKINREMNIISASKLRCSGERECAERQITQVSQKQTSGHQTQTWKLVPWLSYKSEMTYSYFSWQCVCKADKEWHRRCPYSVNLMVKHNLSQVLMLPSGPVCSTEDEYHIEHLHHTVRLYNIIKYIISDPN